MAVDILGVAAYHVAVAASHVAVVAIFFALLFTRMAELRSSAARSYCNVTSLFPVEETMLSFDTVTRGRR